MNQHLPTLCCKQINQESAYSARDFNTIERIREHIQGVSRGALPMGRLLDLLYEDLDSMLTELSGWKEEHHRCNREFRRQMRQAFETIRLYCSCIPYAFIL